jgi:hypothetical protein
MSAATAIERVREAQEDWNSALLAHEQALPDLKPFADRLRATSLAADKQAKALEYAAEAGLRTMAKDPVVRHPPRELSDGANRPGDPKLWTSFDQAVREWQAAWQSGSTLAVAQAVRRLATLTEMLADEVDGFRRSMRTAGTERSQAQDRRAVGQ